MSLLDRWRERDSDQWRRWQQEHRWDALGHYNAERSRGIVHTPEWDAAMAAEQERFNAEHGQEGNVFPVTLRGTR